MPAEDTHFVWNRSLPDILPNLSVAIRGITWGIMVNCSQSACQFVGTFDSKKNYYFHNATQQYPPSQLQAL
jgi:hypothetical protein